MTPEQCFQHTCSGDGECYCVYEALKAGTLRPGGQDVRRTHVLEPEPEYEDRILLHRIAAELDLPSLYMGGPSKQSLRKAENILWIIEDHKRMLQILKVPRNTVPLPNPDEL